ncbi:MAG: hypothetical protein E6G94_01420 [Alphaproteobacteria bacterium]|nr:MAG: hypothetical protein E6G94_01420 [Alphaproteobacteria bacterium]
MSEDSGQPSSRRVVMVAAIFAAIFFCAGLLIKSPEMCVDLAKFVIINVMSLFVITKGIEQVKGNANASSQPSSPPPAA